MKRYNLGATVVIGWECNTFYHDFLYVSHHCPRQVYCRAPQLIHLVDPIQPVEKTSSNFLDVTLANNMVAPGVEEADRSQKSMILIYSGVRSGRCFRAITAGRRGCSLPPFVGPISLLPTVYSLFRTQYQSINTAQCRQTPSGHIRHHNIRWTVVHRCLVSKGEDGKGKKTLNSIFSTAATIGRYLRMLLLF